MKKKILIIIAYAAFAIAFAFLFPAFLLNKEPKDVQPWTMSVSDGTIKVPYSLNEFGLATNPDQVLVKAYIPPCDQDFLYCLYYSGSAHKGTNFESAGLSIKSRKDLKDERSCLDAKPEGYEARDIASSTIKAKRYSSVIYPNLGDAALGHYSLGTMYRLFVTDKNSCYEIVTRIGLTRFENYPEGAIKKFTDADLSIMRQKLDSIVNWISLESGESNLFKDHK